LFFVLCSLSRILIYWDTTSKLKAQSSKLFLFGVICAISGLSLACKRQAGPPSQTAAAIPERRIYKTLPPNSSPQLKKFIDAAVAQAGVTTGYDPSYVGLDYPGGDVPKETGVCSDVIVRAFRAVGIDLQKEIHEDMTRAFADYPKKWGLSRPDSNIDHRRVPNLRTYFTRQQKSVQVTSSDEDYRPGDLVTWDLGGGVDHIGIVTDMLSTPGGHCLIAHNVGAGTRVEDVLFSWKITGHYRYF
jgi:uncharacterized protein